jgi:hypothetical protein
MGSSLTRPPFVGSTPVRNYHAEIELSRVVLRTRYPSLSSCNICCEGGCEANDGRCCKCKVNEECHCISSTAGTELNFFENSGLRVDAARGSWDMFASMEEVDLPLIGNAFHARHPSTAAPTSDDSLYLREVVMQLVIICLFSYCGRRHFWQRSAPSKVARDVKAISDVALVSRSWNWMICARFWQRGIQCFFREGRGT